MVAPSHASAVMTLLRNSFLLLLVLSLAGVARAQTAEISVGPQLSLFGIGAGASVGIGGTFSFSAELGFLPIGHVNLDTDSDIEYESDLSISGGMLGVHVHPFGNNLSLGAGILMSKYQFDVETENLDDTVEIGGDEYDAADVGTMVGEFKLGGAWPAVMLGWRGRGFNLGLGVAFSESPTIDIRATGPIANDPVFQASLDQEVDDVRDDLDISIFPILRIGYQFGIGL